MVQRREHRVARVCLGLLLGIVLGVPSKLAEWTFVGAARNAARARAVQRHVGGFDAKALEELQKDPEKMKQLQAEVDKLMKDPEKMKQMQAFQEQTQSAVEKLRQDPEMKQFFEDIDKMGFEALKKYENDDKVLAKFSAATGGPGAMPGMMGGMPAPGMGGAPAAPLVYKPGDEVYIRGLTKAPQLNGKKAMVVPPSPKEKEELAGTNRIIVRLMDSGEQFAVKPDNLRTSAEEVDEIMSTQSLEDVSVFNPALQSEAAKLRESGALDDLQNDPELKPIFEDIKKNGLGALEKYWNDDKLMGKISKAMGQQQR